MKDFKKEKLILEMLAEIYIFALIIIFPLIVDSSGFFHIFECKWYSFLVISLTYAVANIFTILYYLVFKKTNILENIKLNIIQWSAITFLLINVISCFISPFFKKYNLFIGVGRGEGLITTSIYVITFLLVSLFGKFKKRHILYFAISSILLNVIAILQYIGFNPFNMYQLGIGTHNVSFMSTIGNIDFISALYCILLSISFGAYIFLDDLKLYEKIIYILSIAMGFFIIGIINVQSGKLAFIITLIIILPFIITNNKRLSKFLIVLSSVLFSYCFNMIINPEYHYSIGKLKFVFQFNYIIILYFIVIALLIFVSRILKKYDYDFSSNKKLIKWFYILILFFIICSLIFVYLYNFNDGFLYEIHELLHGNFDDNFGSYRIFLWKRTLKIIPEYPILGSGPDTFAVRFMRRYTQDVAKIGPLTINDTAANVYLTMLVNIGFLGLISYITFIFAQIRKGIEEMNSYSKILLISIICFLIQDFFNLWLVIVTPIFWLLMAIHYISLKNK